jgi:hypothetical protein
MQEQFGASAASSQEEEKRKQRKQFGDVTVEYDPKKERGREEGDDGEYVDYEEVDDR